MKRIIGWMLVVLLVFGCFSFAGAEKVLYQKGNSSQEVLRIKERMQILGYFKKGAELTTEYNATMADHVKELQKNNGLKKTGTITQSLLDLIFSDDCIDVMGNSFSSPDRVLYRKGDRGEEILEIKKRMQMLGYFLAEGALSDEYNSTMEERVKKLQKNNGLTRTGVITVGLARLIFSEECVGEGGKTSAEGVKEFVPSGEKTVEKPGSENKEEPEEPEEEVPEDESKESEVISFAEEKEEIEEEPKEEDFAEEDEEEQEEDFGEEEPAEEEAASKSISKSTKAQAALDELNGRVLTVGAKEPLVKTIKERMQFLSYYSEDSEMSESFNDTMQKKIKTIQKANNMKETGKIDDDFLELIFSDHCVTATGLVMTDANNYLITKEDYTLLGNEQFEVGADGNIIVIILDTLSNTFFNEQLSKKADAAKGLEDFTYFNNYDCCFVGTYPSMVMMLTGYEYDNSVTIGEWFSQAWSSERTLRFFDIMKAKGYETYMYSVAPVNCGLKSEAVGLISNLVKNEDYTGKVVKQKVKQNFYTSLQKNGVTAVPGKRYIIQHLYGLHTPYNVDANGETKKGATCTEATSGWLTITKAYLEELKKAGVYDNSTIIITADHGPKTTAKIQPAFLIKRAGETHEEMEITNAPVSHREFQSTILLCAGAEEDELPSKTVYDFEEDEERERTIYINKSSSDYGRKPKYNGSGYGSHNVWVGYTYTGDSKDLVKEATRHGASDYIEMNCSFN